METKTAPQYPDRKTVEKTTHPIPGRSVAPVKKAAREDVENDPPMALMAERRQQAEKEYLTGNRLYEEGQYCESEAHFNQAMKLSPDKKYSEKQHSAAIGCNTQ